MNMVGRLSIVFCLLLPLEIFSQNFPEFDKLKQKADSAYDIKSYSLSIRYYDSALSLPPIKRPEIFGTIYYDIACVYSLDNKRDSAIANLEKSFSLFYSKTKKTPVSALHLATDTDLDFVRNELRFKNLINKFFSPEKIAFYQNVIRINKKELSYQELLEFLRIVSKETEGGLIVRDKVIYWKKDNGEYVYNKNSLPMPDAEILKNYPLVFENCKFYMNLIWCSECPNGQPFTYNDLRFFKCNFFGRFFLFGLKFNEPPKFLKSNFRKNFELLFLRFDWDNGKIVPNSKHSLEIDSCSFNFSFLRLLPSQAIDISITNNVSRDSSDIVIHCTNSHAVRISGNKFTRKNIYLKINDVDILSLTNNTFNNILIDESNIKSELNLVNNNLGEKTLISRTSNQELNDIEWQSIDGAKIGLLKKYNFLDGGISDEGISNNEGIASFDLVSGEKELDISNPQNFRQLMALYSSFLDLYKSKNDIESYNSCFVMIKELQSKRLKYLYESNPSFEKYFRWKLTQLLRFYVRYGTDPARAIVISIYIIICFGVFFFFFPSDWDTTSKSKLVQNFKDFIQKNEKGYVKPFFILLLGFIVSLINAVTLSLNAFITLGFGNIPTHGIARYFCVLEGFLGWFLLSIFTVAMINQVL
jgi:hypothetical protein